VLTALERHTGRHFLPRYAGAMPVIIEVEIPKDWCIWRQPIDRLRDRMFIVWDEQTADAREFDNRDAFLADVMWREEARVARPVPPEMITAICEV